MPEAVTDSHALVQSMLEITRQCHTAIRDSDYQAAYQYLLQRDNVIRAMAENNVSPVEVWENLRQDEAVYMAKLKQAMTDRSKKINHIKQSKARNAQYKSRPTRTSGVTRGFA